MPIEQVRRIAFDQQELGMGFNSDTGKAVGTALQFDPPIPEPGQEASASASIVTSHEALMESLDLSFEAEGRYAFSSASLKTDFAKSTTYNSVSTFVVARMVVQNQITRGRAFRVTPEAKALLDRNQFDTFATAFGDSFVRGRLTGGEFFAVLRITSVDTSLQTSLGVMLQAELNGVIGAVSFEGEFKKANLEAKTRSEFSVTFYQRGGSGADEIGTTFSLEEIKARLKEFPSAVTNNPFPYQVELATYDTIPIPVPSKQQQEAFVLALADADRRKLEFLQLRNDFEFAAEHPEYFENPPPPAASRAAADTFLRAANAAIAHSVRLSRGEIDPPQLFDASLVTPPLVFPDIKLRKKALDQRAFRDWYVLRDDPSLTQDDHMLVNAIAALAKERINDFDAIPTEEARGEALEAVVAGFRDVRLNQIDVFENDQIVKLTSVEHLGGMLPPGITSLKLDSNNLTSLRGIEGFSQLTELSVSRNKRIEQLIEVAALTALRVLWFNNNHVSDLTPLASCTKLQFVSLGRNRIADLTPLSSLTNLMALMIEAVTLGDPDPDHPKTFNPIQRASGFERNPALANPFLAAPSLSVRFGRLSDGAAGQFTGRADRIGDSLRFKVNLVRGTEAMTDEWTLLAINSREPHTPFVEGPEGSLLVAVWVTSLAQPVYIWSLAQDRPHAIVDRDPDNTELSIDASLPA